MTYEVHWEEYETFYHFNGTGGFGEDDTYELKMNHYETFETHEKALTYFTEKKEDGYENVRLVQVLQSTSQTEENLQPKEEFNPTEYLHQYAIQNKDDIIKKHGQKIHDFLLTISDVEIGMNKNWQYSNDYFVYFTYEEEGYEFASYGGTAETNIDIFTTQEEDSLYDIFIVESGLFDE